jgi:hypothetical protein
MWKRTSRPLKSTKENKIIKKKKKREKQVLSSTAAASKAIWLHLFRWHIYNPEVCNNIGLPTSSPERTAWQLDRAKSLRPRHCEEDVQW